MSGLATPLLEGGGSETSGLGTQLCVGRGAEMFAFDADLEGGAIGKTHGLSLRDSKANFGLMDLQQRSN
ncbi:hypothetical protein Bca52824_023451 [Brassica carinata]|uniref:Uncharacterized protein n=1 Tax=Brassica carinata TaxID=52824 RepID=A0A8X7VI79_BRACI|nr:hypothetical protein Bca52824_023451 [Brassica carinata]